jgi:hypothetical protein
LDHTKSKLVNFKLTEKYYEWLEELANHNGYEGNKSAWLRSQILKGWKIHTETWINTDMPNLKTISKRSKKKRSRA